MTTEPTTPRKAWSKRKKLALLGGLPLGLVALPAAAAVLYFALAGIQGGGENAKTFTAAFDGDQAPTVDASGLTFKPANDVRIEQGDLILPTGLKLFPNEAFTISAKVATGEPGYVSGVELPGLPSGYRAELVSGCGATTQLYGNVQIKVTAPATQTPGAAWSLLPDAGVKVTPLASAQASAPAGVVCAPYVAQ